MSVNGVNEKTEFIDRKKNAGTTNVEVPEPRIAVLSTYTFIGSIYCVFSSILFFSAARDMFLGVAHIMALACVLTNYFILLQTKKYKLASNILLGIGAIIVVLLFASGGWEKTGLLWPIVYLPFAFFLTEKNTGLLWALTLLSGSLIAMMLHLTGAIAGGYSTAEYVEYFAGLVMITSALYIFSNAVVRREEFLSYTNAMLEAAPDAVIMINEKGEINRWNEKAEKLFGWKLSEVEGKLLSSVIIPPRDRESHRKGLNHFLETHGPVVNKSIELKALNRDNQEFDVAISMAPVIIKQKYMGFIRNLTEQKLSEEKYKILFKDNPMPMWVIDYKNNLAFIDVNDAALKHYGYTREEFLSMTSVDIRPETEKERYIQLDRSPQTEGATYAGIWKHLKKDGTVIDVEISTHDIIFDNKDARLILANDVTEKLKAEITLRHREEMLSSIYDTTADTIFVLEVEEGERYRFSSVNKAFQVTTGVPFEMVVGKYVNEIIPQPSLDTVLARYREAIREKKIVRWEETSDYPAGRLTGLVSIAPHFDETGNCVLLVGAVHDITERKKAEDKIIKSEEQYKDLVENITDLICTHDMDGQILSANKAAEEIMGYSFNSEKKWNIKDILSPDKRDAFNEYIALIKEKGHVEGFMKVQTDKGEIRIWEYQNTLKTEGVKTPIVRGYARDITERKKAEQELRESQELLRMLNMHLESIREEERKHLAREVHDILGQQITGLKMDMAWLNKKVSDKDKLTEDRFREMLLLADEMVKTVRKISSELRPGILDDLGLIPALEWQSSEFEKRTGIKCAFTSLSALPQIHANYATGIFRIYQETLTNVARHANATKVDACIDCGQGTVKLIIADNGKGLNTEEMKSKKTLGIIGMKERAAMLKGNLTVQARNEGRTIVTLTVPVESEKNSL